MVKLHIELHDEHFKLLEALAKEEYREVRGQAAYLIGCAVSGWATLQQADTQGFTLDLEPDAQRE